ncbi:MBL fold metallo-hydrolase [Novosphingobium umbonatum]|uniref:MBL fold metallo-hydrolase n=1 Tax=Novosphingobium umbonatum TaxID=1908524 RepID=A0A3S2UV49_9SPHN|nr:MBL fold metallo-hydrolase [Novosphingobium umbonatum]RVU05846.1 MBL fold metallo-hydrolase [Novosphingobium umbonatum]
MRKSGQWLLMLACGLLPLAQATAQTAQPYSWVTLGTMGGPMPRAGRNEPANLLMRRGEAHLIDTGDGAMTGMALAGADYPDLRSIWISHIHFDHLGGLFAVLGLRLQTRTTVPLTIYGPPGMKEIVSGLIAAMRPSALSGFGIEGEVALDPAASIRVVELDDDAQVQQDGFRVKVATNSHYSFAPGSVEERTYRSLSFRFELPDRAIVYTGDTGPSENVTRLAQGADLLVTEMIDLDDTLAQMNRRVRHISDTEKANMAAHLTRHHLSPAAIGIMAQKAGVKAVVVTHIAGGGASDAGADARYQAAIGQQYQGPVRIAKDRDHF